MKDADMIFGFVSSEGEINVTDCYSTGNNGPHPPDIELGGTSDILAYGGTEKNGITIVEFTRQLKTGDQFDKDIPQNETIDIIWALGPDDDFNSKHSKLGSSSLEIGKNETIQDNETETNDTLDGIISEGEYDFSSSFSNGKFKIHWKFNNDKINIAMVGETTGWVALGIEPTVAMKDADMIFGWVDEDGNVSVVDAFSTGPTGPHPPDTELGGNFNILAYGGTQKDGITTIEFQRLLNTNDEYDKIFPSNGSIKIIWATSSSDNFNAKHDNLGSGVLNFQTGNYNEKKETEYWPFHAFFMTVGFILILKAIVIVKFYKKEKWWLKYHKTFGLIGAIFAIIGLIIGLYMVNDSTGEHFRVGHAKFGILTILLITLTPIFGLMIFKIKNSKNKIKILHKMLGRTAIFFMIITIFSGLKQAGVI